MELSLPPFKTRSALVESLVIVNKQACAIVTLSETRWWGLKKRHATIRMSCGAISKKQPEWSSYENWSDRCYVFPVCKASDVVDVANKTLRDMRSMNMVNFNQLIAHRLSIHMRKHHGKTFAAHL